MFGRSAPIGLCPVATDAAAYWNTWLVSMVIRGRLLSSLIEFAADCLSLLSRVPHDLFRAKLGVPNLDLPDNATKPLSRSLLQGFELCRTDNHRVGLALLLNGDDFLSEFYP